nr:hypothetical protein GCM10020093_070520 [Planobispora longispora]
MRLTAGEADRVRQVSPVPVEDVWPLSPLQEGIFFHSTYDAGDADAVDVYTSQDVFTFTGRIDADRLRAACAALLARNPSLRAGFTGEGCPGRCSSSAPTCRPRCARSTCPACPPPSRPSGWPRCWPRTGPGGSTCPARR